MVLVGAMTSAKAGGRIPTTIEAPQETSSLMKSSMFLIAATAAASFAAPAHFSIEAKGGYNFLYLGDDLGTGLAAGSPEAKASFGIAIGPMMTYALTEQFLLGGGATFQYDKNRYDNSYDLGVLGSNKEEHTIDQLSLGLQFAPLFRVSERLSVKLGYEWDMPIGGTSENKRTTTVLTIPTTATDKADIVWAPAKQSDLGTNDAPTLSTHNVVFGFGYQMLPGMEFTLQSKIALTGSVPLYKANGDLDGAASRQSNMMVNQVALGVRLALY
jgi:hypothetical protein